MSKLTKLKDLDRHDVYCMAMTMGSNNLNVNSILADKIHYWKTKGILTTTEEVIHFIAQCGHETVGYKHFEENLRYTSASRIKAVFGRRRFPTIESAIPFVKNARLLANKVYNGRMGNRGGSDDGWYYRGSGPIHLTGSNNFNKYSKLCNIKIHEYPEKARDISVGFDVALQYFLNTRYKKRNVFYYARKGDVNRVSRMINGGINGMNDRIKRTHTLYALLGGVQTTRKILRVGSRSKQVKAVQTKLNIVGYNVGKVDGRFGNTTYQQVCKLQKDNKLIIDGIVGTQVYKILGMD